MVLSSIVGGNVFTCGDARLALVPEGLRADREVGRARFVCPLRQRRATDL